MHEILVISGKGGAGKTTVTGAFAHLSENTILCDLDVDAPDFHLISQPEQYQHHEFWSGYEAKIRQEDCTQCGECFERCRFDAITHENGTFAVDPMKCEGCKVCVALCPAEAVDFTLKNCGEWYRSETRFGHLVHAQLYPGEENSGRLVALLKDEARKTAREHGHDILLADGAPGIGCPVISSLSGTDLAVFVTEPTPSGLHDLERVAALCDHFRVKGCVVINKYDLNTDMTEKIESFCAQQGYPVAGRVPHADAVTAAMVERKAVTEFDSTMYAAFDGIWKNVLSQL
ncbi:ATP-binding protein [Halodesulfovibrio spirochaetisodalis]|uniref:(4Fe-4S)-binding protein n=1 Tax=Halodesulfovibrio spirochaetisodalis TaxID=1560234 RepID=A0A1B7XE59_9BACT|nr:ATP-binding protein [Halodesulfovibrio spirochaetisodalis]OBQ52432.1 (4Fe-4S)-binding protein [Halodesulfovibrio spirochaetisodalis]